MAWAAVQGELDLPAWLLLGAAAAWAVAYDTIYALQDREDDRRIGVKSAALFFGSYIHLGVGAAYAVMLALLGAAGWMSHIGWAYYGTLLVAGVLCLRQIGELRKPVAPSQALRMFRAQVWIGVAILGGMVAGFLV
jgi:4-hydroxybenzoate polyprenyltransferase